MENSKIVKVREIFFLIIFTLIIFQNPLMNLHSNFRYIDEFCFVLSVIYIIFYLCIYRKCEKNIYWHDCCDGAYGFGRHNQQF